MEHPAFLGFAALVLIVGLAAKRVTVLVVCITILIVLTFCTLIAKAQPDLSNLTNAPQSRLEQRSKTRGTITQAQNEAFAEVDRVCDLDKRTQEQLSTLRTAIQRYRTGDVTIRRIESERPFIQVCIALDLLPPFTTNAPTGGIRPEAGGPFDVSVQGAAVVTNTPGKMVLQLESKPTSKLETVINGLIFLALIAGICSTRAKGNGTDSSAAGKS